LVSKLSDAVQHWKMWRHCISGSVRKWLLHAADVQLGHGQTRLVVHAALPTTASLCCMFVEGNRGVYYCSLAVVLYTDYWIGCLVEAWSSGCCILSFVIVFGDASKWNLIPRWGVKGDLRNFFVQRLAVCSRQSNGCVSKCQSTEEI